MSKKQTVYLVSGVLGAGKTSLSKRLNKGFGCVVVDGDSFFVPLESNEALGWDRRLSISWKNIVAVTKNYLDEGLDVVIDFVVEDELSWFLEQLGTYDVGVKYIILIADTHTLKERLHKRDGSTQFLDRSLILLDKITKNQENSKYIVDTSHMETADVLKLLTHDSKFVVKD